MRAVKMLIAVIVALAAVSAAAIALSLPDGKSTCESAGGQWESAGLEGNMVCIHAFPDGGKPCASSAECAGSCVITPQSDAGHCKQDDNLFGCYVEIEKYRETHMIICTD